MHTIPHRLRVTEGIFHYPYLVRNTGVFERANISYLRRNFSTAGDRRNWSISMWYRKPDYTSDCTLLSQGSAGNTCFFIKVTAAGQLVIRDITAGVPDWTLATSGRWRDTSHWTHILVTFASSIPTEDNRVTVYINGREWQGWGIETYPSLDFQSYFMSVNQLRVGNDFINDAMDGGLAQVAILDGQTPGISQFGEFIGNTFVPKDLSGLTFGDEGCLLDFSDAALPEKDVSGNGNHFINDGVYTAPDSPTNVYPVIDPYYGSPSQYGAVTHAGRVFDGSTNWSTRPITIPLPLQGRWVIEITNLDAITDGAMVGVCDHTLANDNNLGSGGISAYQSNGTIYENGSIIATDKATWNAVSDTVQVVWRADNQTLHYYQDGSIQSSRSLGAYIDERRTLHFAVSCNATARIKINPDQTSHIYTTNYPNARSLCGANLPEPNVREGEEGFWCPTWQGNGTSQNIVGARFDLTINKAMVIAKQFSDAMNHLIFDTERGRYETLYVNTTAAEFSSNQTLADFLSNGFSIGTSTGVNESAERYVGWVFNMLPRFGMDIVEYVGTGVNRYDIPHNLGAPPEMIIIKSRDSISHWRIGHEFMHPTSPWSYVLSFDTAAAVIGGWASQTPTSTVFGLGTDSNVNTLNDNYVACLFRSIPGFSKCGFYFGNGSYYGPRIYLDFKPRMLFIKAVNDTQGWPIFDSVRKNMWLDTPGPNPVNNPLLLHSSAAEQTVNFDFLSNGFKVYTSENIVNRDGYRYIYFAIADMPFPFTNAF